MTDRMHDEVKHYIRMLEDYQWSSKELYEARIQLSDIAEEFQPVRSVPTDKQVIENFRMTNEDMILEKLHREEQAQKRINRAERSMDEVHRLVSCIIDVVERELISDLYLTRSFTRDEVAVKYGYEVSGMAKKVYRIVKKAVKLMKVPQCGA